MVLLLCLASLRASAQDAASADARFGYLLQHYHQVPDKQVVPLTIDYLNRHSTDSAQTAALKQQGRVLAGFLTVLLAQDTTLRQQLRTLRPQLANSSCREFIAEVLHLTPDQLFAKVPLGPAYNDMAWAAYGATGNTHYLQLVLDNCRYAAERKSLNLYLTGASARWSLCSMAQQEPVIKHYLTSQRTSAEARLVLRSSPAALRQQMMEQLAQIKQRGNWQP